jgi:glycosyltransferase involved in cell wall biosynthesis
MKVKDIISQTEWIPNPFISSLPPKFSIFMPTFRRGASGHLKRAIQSVLRQTFKDFELIIIDDGSVDGSFDIIKQFMELDARIHCLHHPKNVGLPALACYEAYLMSKGEYLMFCFDDTEYKCDVLKKIEEVISEKKIKIAFGYIEWESIANNGDVVKSLLGKEYISQKYLSITNFLPNLGVVIQRDVPREIGFLDPHLAIARVTDWDYWKRAAKVYEIHRLNIFVGTEYGLVSGNSLGLTYPLNTSLSFEWTELDRNDLLKPGNYEEYDVQAIPSELSYLAKLTLCDLSQFYSSKFWYSFASDGKNAVGQLELQRIGYGKVLVVAPELSASISLPFENLSDSYFRFTTLAFLDFKDIMSAQAIIICRDLVAARTRQLVKIARLLNINLYYYLDDNFIVLSEEIDVLREYTRDNLIKLLSGFSGVLVPTSSLADFFLNEKLHDNVYVFPPILPARIWHDYPVYPVKSDGVLRIGFMGGSHRNQNFLDYILPAILRLAKERKIELIVAGNLQIPDHMVFGLTVYKFPFDISYELTIGRMVSSEIDILVHAGSSTNNNPYKTLNVLVNAWAIGATPVLAKQPPYENVEKDGLGLLCDAESSESWYEKLLMAATNPAVTKQISKKIDSFLHYEYSGQKNLNVIQKILSDELPLGFSVVENRYRSYISYAATTANTVQNQNPENLTISHVRLFSSLLYTIQVTSPNWCGFEFVFGTFGTTANGNVFISIKQRDTESETIVHTALIEMEKIQDNQAVIVEFPAISSSANKTYDILFRYKPSKNRSKIALYENNPFEGKLKRILRRLRIIRRGNNLACRLIYADEQ